MLVSAGRKKTNINPVLQYIMRLHNLYTRLFMNIRSFSTKQNGEVKNLGTLAVV